MEKYYYCPVCKKQINTEDTVRKPMDTMQKIIWAIIILATLGGGLIVFIIYYYFVKEKIYCPVCSTKLTVSSEPFEKEEKEEEPKTARGRVLKKAGKELPEKKKKVEEKKEKPEKEKELFCPFCGNKLEPGTKVCPSCGTSIEDR
ncbi:MAG: zinc ribbon domain-containing protein [Promethearchaeota archaeon]|nr:MAG: zinc ribbon domain-containing protein [Candidatus Lokiarchaeota archaeon]